MAIFEGSGVAIITPFHADGSVNYEKLGELIDYQIEHGTDSIIICGTTGEASTLTHEEHIECIRYAVARTAKRVPVIAGTGSNCTKTAIYLSKEAEQAGADAVLLVSPYYNKATQKGLIEHFTQIVKSLQIPAILYNIPGRTGCNILPSTVAYLAKNVDQIVAIKEATGDLKQAIETMCACEGRIDLYSGDDNLIVPMLSIGGKGVISVLSNVAPRDTHEIVARYLAKDIQGSLKLQLRYLPLIKALFSEVNPIPVKQALNLMGFEVGGLRSPLTPMEPEHTIILKQELEKAGLC